MKVEQQQSFLKPIMIKYQGLQQQKQIKFKGTIGYNDREDPKRIKTEASALDITSDQIILCKLIEFNFEKQKKNCQILLQRDDNVEKTGQKAISKLIRDEMGLNEFQLSGFKSNQGRNILDEDIINLKRSQQNQQHQYLEFWQQQSMQGKYLDQLPIIGNQNQSLPLVAPQKSPQNQGNRFQYGNINNSKIRNYSAASKDPLKTPQIKQFQVQSSKSNKKNSFYLMDNQKEQKNLTKQDNTANKSLQQIENEENSKSDQNSPINKQIPRSYTTERVNLQNESYEDDLVKNQHDDNKRRSSQFTNKIMNRSATRTPNKNQQAPPFLQQLFNNSTNNSDVQNSNDNNKILQKKTKWNQNNIQQMRNLQNSQEQQYNSEMYNFYYNQDQQSPLTSKRNSQKNNLQLNKDNTEYLQQQIQEKYQLNKPQNQQHVLNYNNKVNRNTPLRYKKIENGNDLLNKSDNCLLTPLKLSPSPKESSEPIVFNLGMSQDQLKLQKKEKPLLQTKQIAAPPAFKKEKLKIRSKENFDQYDQLNEGRNIKTEGSAFDHINIISSTQNKQNINIKQHPSQQIYSSSTTKKQKFPQNLKEAVIVRSNKTSSENQINLEEQNQILKNLRNMKQKNIFGSITDQNNTNESIDNIDKISDNSKEFKDNQQKDNISKKISFHNIDSTIQREESISQIIPVDKLIENQDKDKILQNTDKQFQNANCTSQHYEQTDSCNQKHEQSETEGKCQNSLITYDNKSKTIEQSSIIQDQQNFLEFNQFRKTTLQNSLSETPNRTRSTTFQTEKAQSKQESVQESLKQQQIQNNNQQEVNGKKPLLKVKLNLEILLFIEEKLFLIFEQVQFHDNISFVHTCKDYLELITSCEQERLEVQDNFHINDINKQLLNNIYSVDQKQKIQYIFQKQVFSFLLIHNLYFPFYQTKEIIW